jgi:hypothetical protein
VRTNLAVPDTISWMFWEVMSILIRLRLFGSIIAVLTTFFDVLVKVGGGVLVRLIKSALWKVTVMDEPEAGTYGREPNPSTI